MNNKGDYWEELKKTNIIENKKKIIIQRSKAYYWVELKKPTSQKNKKK